MSDVVIVGGGPVGAAAALALAQAGHGVTVLEARPTATADDRRTLAIAYGSQQILAGLGAWPAESTPITDIHVSQRGHFGQTVLTAAEAGVPALGYVLRYNALVQAQARAMEDQPAISLVTGATVDAVTPGEDGAEVVWRQQGDTLRRRTPLAVLADGGRALTAATFGTPVERPYTQVALVGQVHTDRPHDGRAYERFTPTGPVALLPYERHYALVWTGTQEAVEALIALPEAEFLRRLQDWFG
ncbi:MAG: FAD-dependent oxidoreductase, partial [Betaproteobacteria bacterium]|nr:FAD-dependent oxidoreductase [Betaproteobacteria bacterium]